MVAEGRTFYSQRSTIFPKLFSELSTILGIPWDALLVLNGLFTRMLFVRCVFCGCQEMQVAQLEPWSLVGGVQTKGSERKLDKLELRPKQQNIEVKAFQSFQQSYLVKRREKGSSCNIPNRLVSSKSPSSSKMGLGWVGWGVVG